MVRRVNHQDSVGDRGKIRFVYAEVEGNNQSLQDLMKAMMATMNPVIQVAPSPKRIASSNSKPVEDDEPSLFNEMPETQDQVSSAEPTVEVGGNGNKRARGEGPKVDRNSGMNLVADLDLMPNGKQSLKDFVAEKKPGTAEEQVLVFVYYMSQNLGLTPITANHVLSCFKPLGKKIPVDLRATIRNVAKNKAWLNADFDNLRITTQGTNHVEHELGKDLPAS